MNRYALLLIPIFASACVSTSKFKAQQTSAAEQQKRADDLARQLSAATEASQKLQAELAAAAAQLTDAANQLAAAQKSNKDLQEALDAKKGELNQKVASLIKERDAMAQQLAQAEAARVAAETAKTAELEKAKKSFEDLTSGLKSEIAAGEITISQLKGKLTVNLVDRILFDSGKAEVKDAGRQVLDKVGGILNTVQDKNIRIEGHTDNKPITGELMAKYPSNWELSTARATAVARYLQDRAKVDASRLLAAGYGEYHPVAPNDTPESRALNRRIEIVLVPRD